MQKIELHSLLFSQQLRNQLFCTIFDVELSKQVFLRQFTMLRGYVLHLYVKPNWPENDQLSTDLCIKLHILFHFLPPLYKFCQFLKCNAYAYNSIRTSDRAMLRCYIMPSWDHHGRHSILAPIKCLP